MNLQCILGVGKRGEGRRVHDAFVEDESVAFVSCDDPKMFGGGTPPEEIRVHHVNVASFVEGLCDLINQIFTHDVIVKLLRSTDVQGEPSHFAAVVTLTGLVAIILRTRGSESSSFVISPR